MLKADCCGNYLCVYCADDINDFIKMQKLEKPTCHFCKQEDFSVSDVTAEEKVRRYTDSPYSSASNTLTASMTKNLNLNSNLKSSFANKSKRLSATFNGFSQGCPKLVDEPESHQANIESQKAASCGFKNMRDVRRSVAYSDDECDNREDLEEEMGGRKLFSTLETYQLTIPTQQQQDHVDFGEENKSYENVNNEDSKSEALPKQMISSS